MTAIAIDTLKIAKSLRSAGFTEPQTEALTNAVLEAAQADSTDIATKSDIFQLRTEIAEAKADILKWMIGMIVGAVVINAITVVAAMLALAKMLGK